jgi:hemerythrin-like metal-binding domain
MLWDDTYACGISSIDEQHRELFRRVEMLTDETREGRLAEMLDFLSTYVVNHFTYEQLMHRKYRYPQAVEHQVMHDRFIQVYGAIKAEYAAKGNNPETLEKLVKTTRLWLKKHIMGMDMEFAEFYRLCREDSRRFLSPQNKVDGDGYSQQSESDTPHESSPA